MSLSLLQTLYVELFSSDRGEHKWWKRVLLIDVKKTKEKGESRVMKTEREAADRNSRNEERECGKKNLPWLVVLSGLH